MCENVGLTSHKHCLCCCHQWCIVLLTAKGQEADKQKGMAAGADGYMTKPFRMGTILGKAREVLDL